MMGLTHITGALHMLDVRLLLLLLMMWISEYLRLMQGIQAGAGRVLWYTRRPHVITQMAMPLATQQLD